MLFVAQLWGHKENPRDLFQYNFSIKETQKSLCNFVSLNIDEKDKGSNFEINIRIND